MRGRFGMAREQGGGTGEPPALPFKGQCRIAGRTDSAARAGEDKPRSGLTEAGYNAVGSFAEIAVGAKADAQDYDGGSAPEIRAPTQRPPYRSPAWRSHRPDTNSPMDFAEMTLEGARSAGLYMCEAFR